MKRFLGPGGKEAIAAAVRAIEQRSSAELVVTVRPWAGSFLAADLLWAVAAAALTLGLGLFAPWPVSTLALLLDPLAAGLAFFLLSRSVPALRRIVTPSSRRRSRVLEAAEALFHHRRVHQTRGRTGVLAHVSLLERRVELIADIGVEEAVDEQAWRDAEAALCSVIERGEGALAFAAVLERLGDVLEPALPREVDDVNELPDEPCA